MLHTPPISGGSPVKCEVKNIGNTAAEVTIEMILEGGPLHVQKLTTTIAPLQSASVYFTGSTSVCRFTVSGGRRKFLASGCAAGGGRLEAH